MQGIKKAAKPPKNPAIKIAQRESLFSGPAIVFGSSNVVVVFTALGVAVSTVVTVAADAVTAVAVSVVPGTAGGSDLTLPHVGANAHRAHGAGGLPHLIGHEGPVVEHRGIDVEHRQAFDAAGVLVEPQRG